MPIADILAVTVMSSLSLKRWFVRFGPIADIATIPDDVRFTPNSGHYGCGWNVRTKVKFFKPLAVKRTKNAGPIINGLET